MERSAHFDRYRLDLETGRLWSGDREIRLTPKASAVLLALVTRAGEPVTKDSLFATVWNGTAVSDDALTSCVQELRKAFGDDARRPRFIETRHRRGYRFVAAIGQAAGTSAAGAASTEAPPANSAADEMSAIAVLPFADMSPGRDQDYLCEGLAEELINALTNISGLRVASRTASFRFRAANVDLREVGRELKVGTLLEGSVRKADDRLRVSVQLVEVSTGFQRWSQRFDRRLVDVFAIQDEIALSVATSLRGGVLSGREKQALSRPQTGTAAYEYYLRGRQHLPRMTRNDLQIAGEMFERAIALDAEYAPALAGLASVYATQHEWLGSRPGDLERAQRASRRALELAPGLAEAHVAHGFVLSLSGRYDEATLAFEEAIRINSNLFDAYYYFARTSFAQGEIARSAMLFGRAAAVRQDDFQSAVLEGQSLRMLGRIEESNVATREGIRRAEHILELNPVDGRALSLGGCALFHDGQIDRAIAWARRAIELYPEDGGALINAACLHAKLGQSDEALLLLERAFVNGWGKRDWIDHDPDYDILRDNPRFQALLERIQ